MSPSSFRAVLRIAAVRGWLTMVSSLGLLVVLSACNRGDVGAPCNHGDVEPPPSKLVTFPALMCDQLLCIYADSEEPPTGACNNDEDCNVDPSINRFECVQSDTGSSCKLRLNYVLQRSMCSKQCSSDADCQNSGPFDNVVVDDNACESQFVCRRLQRLGDFCCQKMCVCEDDLVGGGDTSLDQECSQGTADPCCTEEPIGEGCGT